MKQIVCPISDEKINEKITRLNALLGILLLCSAFLLNSGFFLVLLTADFYVRAFTRTKHSPISYVSHWLTNAFGLTEKHIDKAPKIFAARLGFVMMLAITFLFFGGFNSASLAVGGILVFFASLEFALGICVGCIIYTYVILPFYR